MISSPSSFAAGDELGDRSRAVRRVLGTYGTAHELEVRGRRLERLGAELEQTIANLAGRGDDRAAGVERGLAAARAHVPDGRVGVLVEDRDLVGLQAELVGGQQSEAHDRAGAVLLRARHHGRRAVPVELDGGVRGDRKAEPPAAGEPDALSVRSLVPANQLGCLLDALLHADRVEDLAGRALVAGDGDVAEPKLERVDAERSGDLVGVLLDGPADLRAGRRATDPAGVRFV